MGISNLKQEKKKENRHQIVHIVHNFIFNKQFWFFATNLLKDISGWKQK